MEASAATIGSSSTLVSSLDPSKLALPQNFAAVLGVEKMITTVPVRKPNRQEFVRVHPGEDHRLQTMVLELKDDRESYLVAPDLWSELAGEAVPKVLYTGVTRQNVAFIWPVRLPSEDGRVDSWSQSAMEAAGMAMENWVRVAANMSLGAYEIYKASAELPPPTWPKLDFASLLNIAFKGRYINNLEHPVLRRLRGAA